ncbi:hypothetical protein NIES2130_19955 [Scytonema sp. HK-05]|nr:hypothetical protein NIES2130_19955 [Scytonema sp. HK-05]
MGILPALNIGTGGDTPKFRASLREELTLTEETSARTSLHPTRKFGIFFYLEVPKTTTVHLCKYFSCKLLYYECYDIINNINYNIKIIIKK